MASWYEMASDLESELGRIVRNAWENLAIGKRIKIARQDLSSIDGLVEYAAKKMANLGESQTATNLQDLHYQARVAADLPVVPIGLTFVGSDGLREMFPCM